MAKAPAKRRADDLGFSNWDLKSYFPGFDGPEYRSHWEQLESGLEQLGKDAERLGEISSANVHAWAEIFVRRERLYAAYSHLGSYLSCLTAAHNDNEEYRRHRARLSTLGATFKKANVPVTAAMKSVGDDCFEALAGHPHLASVRYYMERERQEAKWSMDADQEKLAADLGVFALSAWGQLYDTVSGSLAFTMKWPDGRRRRIPMAQKRTLMEDRDERVRKAAFRGSNKAWESVQDVLAACLNGISGSRLTLYRYRGVGHFLDVAMFGAGVERRTIDAMWQTISENREVPRRYLRRKAEIFGKERLGFYDLDAPLPVKATRRFPWKEAADYVVDAFASRYEEMGEFARDMLEEKRVESERRPAKRPGAFCTTSKQSGESRVYMTYGGSVGDIQTLAHELGHAYHSYVMRDLRPYARQYPMTLAETASTFAEDLLGSSLLRDPAVDQTVKGQILVTRLNHAAVFLLNIHTRYLFETAFYEERESGEITVSRIKELMLEAQRECYGDVLAEEEMDPMFWASKLHFYIVGVPFYNFPYTFGYLFSQGLSARAEEEGPEFLRPYRELLRMTGSAPAEEVARRTLGVDLGEPGFWKQAIDRAGRDLALFEDLVPPVLELDGNGASEGAG